MEVHGISIFSHKKAIPEFDNILDPLLRIHSGNLRTPEITIFFADIQEATNFKNAVIQSWETFLRETAKEKNKSLLTFQNEPFEITEE